MEGRARRAEREKSIDWRAGVEVPDLPETEGLRERLPAAAARSAEAWDMAVWVLPACAWVLPAVECAVEGVRMGLLLPLIEDEER